MGVRVSHFLPGRIIETLTLSLNWAAEKRVLGSVVPGETGFQSV